MSVRISMHSFISTPLRMSLGLSLKVHVVMAHIVMAYIVMAYIVMASIVMAYIVMACIVMAYIVMAYIVMALYSYGRLYALRSGHEKLPWPT